MKKVVSVTHSGGVGDGLMFSSIIKEHYSKEYEEVYLNVPRLNFLFNRLYRNIPNIKLVPYSGNASTIHRALKFEDAVKHESWRRLTWDRDLIAEESLYREVVSEVGNDYIVVHERYQDNMDRKMFPIETKYFENSDLPVVNLHNRKGHILDYTKVLNSAKEIHMYEGSFMNLVDSVLHKEIPLYGHLYCKPHYFNTNMVHYQIIEYIRKGVWHKNKWNYIWEK